MLPKAIYEIIYRQVLKFGQGNTVLSLLILLLLYCLEGVNILWLMLDSGVLYRNIRHNHLKLFNYSLRRIKTAIMDNSLKIQYVMVNQRDKTLKHNMSQRKI